MNRSQARVERERDLVGLTGGGGGGGGGESQ